MINSGFYSHCCSPFQVVSLKNFDRLNKTANKTQNKHNLGQDMSLVPYRWKCRSWPLTSLLSELAFSCDQVKWNVVVTIHVMNSYLQPCHTKQCILNIFFSHIVGFTRSIPEYNSYPSVWGYDVINISCAWFLVNICHLLGSDRIFCCSNLAFFSKPCFLRSEWINHLCVAVPRVNMRCQQGNIEASLWKRGNRKPLVGVWAILNKVHE